MSGSIQCPVRCPAALSLRPPATHGLPRCPAGLHQKPPRPPSRSEARRNTITSPAKQDINELTLQCSHRRLTELCTFMPRVCKAVAAPRFPWTATVGLVCAGRRVAVGRAVRLLVLESTDVDRLRTGTWAATRCTAVVPLPSDSARSVERRVVDVMVPVSVSP
jgi:hypothetical protein